MLLAVADAAQELVDRRAFLGRYAGGLGSLALAQLAAAEDSRSRDPLAPKKPHHPAKAKAVIDEAAEALAAGIGNVLALLHPERFIIGGGVGT